MREQRGRHFDPGCVTALLRRIDEVIDIQKKFSEDGIPASEAQAGSSAILRSVANA
jgi:HD-GYP domain-containing protein (c-di-GMP phosphodiesterase class II)